MAANKGSKSPARKGHAARGQSRAGSESANRTSRKPVAAKVKGKLLLIGGREDKTAERSILRRVVDQVDKGRLLVVTIASELANECWLDYQRVFKALGVKRVEHLIVERREKEDSEPPRPQLDGVDVVFFTGGDQLRITTKLGGTHISEELESFYQKGGLIAGTSAGASALGEMMLVGHQHEGSYRVGDAFQMVPGLGILRDVMVDQHFSERGRIRRLLGAVAQNPRMLGLGIDEDTAALVEAADRFSVIGSGAVYIIDGHGVSWTNITEESPEKTMSVFGLRLHVLSQDDSFDLREHVPKHPQNDAG